jgi:hypothetical protein
MTLSTPLRLTSEDIPDLCREATQEQQTPGPPGVLTVVGGSINQTALRKRTAEAGVPADSYAATTVERMATTLVEVSQSAGDVDVVEDAWVRARVREELSQQEEDTPLGTVATRHGRDIESIVTALKEWWRATDGGSTPDKRQLSTVLESVPALHQSSVETLFTAFGTLTERLERDLRRTTFLSRSHLVREARYHITHWNDVWPSIEQIYIGSISVLDNALLRFIVELADHEDVPPITFCAGVGTLERFYRRVKTAAEDKSIAVPAPEHAEEPDIISYLTDIARGASPEQTAEEVLESGTLDVECVSLPRRRDEMAYVMQATSAVEAAGGRGSQVLAVAPDAGEYRGYARTASRRYNVPVYVESRFPLAHTPLVRAVKSAFELVDSVKPSVDSVLKPLEFGALPAGSPHERPLEDTALASVREEVGVSSASLADWVEALQQTSTSAGNTVAAFIEMVRATQRQAVTGAEVERLVCELVESYPTVTTGELGWYRPGRVKETDTYPADRTRQDVLRVGRRVAKAVSALESPSWSDVSDVFTTSLAGAGTGRPNNDGMAVQLVDAGNTYFRKRPWVIITGLSEGMFPSIGTSGSLIPDTVRTAVEASNDPYLYFDSEEAQVARAVDEYHATLRCATERVTLLRPSRDTQGREQPPSRFVGDLFGDKGGQSYGVGYHEIDGFLDSEAPARWLESPPASLHERLSVLGLNASPTPAGQQSVVRETPTCDERLVDIAATLDERFVDEMDGAAETLRATLNEPVLPPEVDVDLREAGPTGVAGAEAD